MNPIRQLCALLIEIRELKKPVQKSQYETHKTNIKNDVGTKAGNKRLFFRTQPAD